jgi:outer membrane biosynthesis protein TonB
MSGAAIDAEARLSTAPLPGGGKPLAAALIVSILLHFLLAWLWATTERRDEAAIEPALVAIPMEFVEPPAPPPPPPPPPQAPRAAPAPVTPPAPPPPLVPQLETATPAERSTSTTPETRPDVVPPIDRRATPAPVLNPAPREAARPEPPAPDVQPPQTSADGLLPPPPPVVPRRPAPAAPVQPPQQAQDSARPAVGGGRPSEKVTQAETDFLLAQILRNWLLDYSNPRFARIQISFSFVIDPDGMLGDPMNARAPLDYRQVISDYDSIVAASARNPDARDARALLESFVVAARAAQPFARQPGTPPVTQPRTLEIRFLMGDLPPRR